MALTSDDYIKLGFSEYDKAEAASSVYDKRSAFMTASGYFELAQKQGKLDAEIHGFLAEFYISYSVFLADEGGDPKSSEKRFNLAKTHANTALKLDPNEIASRLIFFAIDVDTLSRIYESKSKSSGLLDWVIGTSDYSRAKKSLSNSTRLLASAFEALLIPNVSVVYLLDLIDRTFYIIDTVVDPKIDFTPLYRSFLRIKESGIGMKIYVDTDAEEELVKEHHAITVGKLMANISEFESRH